MPDLVLGHADSGILDGKPQGDVLGYLLDKLQFDANLPLGGELDRVAYKVVKDLGQADGIPDDHLGHYLRAIEEKFQILLNGFDGLHLHRLANEIVKTELGLLHLHLAGLNLGEVQNVVDDSKERLGRRLGPVDIFMLLGIQLGLEAKMAQPDDGVHGSADLMAHVGQKLALGFGAGLGGLPSLAKGPLFFGHVGDVHQPKHEPYAAAILSFEGV